MFLLESSPFPKIRTRTRCPWYLAKLRAVRERVSLSAFPVHVWVFFGGGVVVVHLCCSAGVWARVLHVRACTLYPQPPVSFELSRLEWDFLVFIYNLISFMFGENVAMVISVCLTLSRLGGVSQTSEYPKYSGYPRLKVPPALWAYARNVCQTSTPLVCLSLSCCLLGSCEGALCSSWQFLHWVARSIDEAGASLGFGGFPVLKIVIVCRTPPSLHAPKKEKYKRVRRSGSESVWFRMCNGQRM